MRKVRYRTRVMCRDSTRRIVRIVFPHSPDHGRWDELRRGEIYWNPVWLNLQPQRNAPHLTPLASILFSCVCGRVLFGCRTKEARLRRISSRIVFLRSLPFPSLTRRITRASSSRCTFRKIQFPTWYRIRGLYSTSLLRFRWHIRSA